jgi:aldehyde dehydrogenase (NAD+)
MTAATAVVSSTSPQDPTDLIVEVPEAGPADVAAAAAAARSAQREWWAAGAPARKAALAGLADRLRARADEAAALLVREVGKPVAESRGEVARAAAILDFNAELAFAPLGETFPASPPVTGSGALVWTERRPRGVAGLITPWNFPLAIPLWKAAPALACGNAVLLKPSPEAVAAALLIAELAAGLLPDGLLAVLPGGASTGRAVVAAADVVSFTGSVAVGSDVAAAATARGVPVQCEMGGQNAAIVLPDADAGLAAAVVAAAAMGFAGQKCTATRRAVVVGGRRRIDEVADALVSAVAGLPFGDPADPATVVGPVVTAAARDRVLDAVALAWESGGGDVLTGGDVPDRPGWFVRPALVTGLPADHPLTCEETFGPVLALQPAHDVDAALALARGVRFGLVTSVHGRDVSDLLRVVAGADTGLVRVNAPTTGVDFYAPFGGEKASSLGPREQGTAALQLYSSTRTVTLAPHP